MNFYVVIKISSILTVCASNKIRKITTRLIRLILVHVLEIVEKLNSRLGTIQSHTLVPYRVGQRKDRMCHLHGLDGINLSSIFK
jgi:hypothetical protein